MMLEEGEVITLDSNGKDYIVIKKVNYKNENYYYMMTIKKPIEVLIIKLGKNELGQEIIITETDKNIIEEIIKISTEEV